MSDPVQIPAVDEHLDENEREIARLLAEEANAMDAQAIQDGNFGGPGSAANQPMMEAFGN